MLLCIANELQQNDKHDFNSGVIFIVRLHCLPVGYTVYRENICPQFTLTSLAPHLLCQPSRYRFSKVKINNYPTNYRAVNENNL